MSFFSSLIDSIVDFVKGLWDMLGPLLVIAIIVFIACAPYLVTVLGTGSAFALSMPAWLSWLPALVTAAASWGPLGAALAGFGLAYLVDPTATTDIVSNVAEGVGTIIGTTVGAVAAGVTTSSGLMSWLMIGGAAFIAYKVLTSDKRDDKDRSSTRTTSSVPPRIADTSRGYMPGGIPRYAEG